VGIMEIGLTSRVEFSHYHVKNANKIEVEKATGCTSSGGIFVLKYAYF
jgi:hypothetical protein